MIKTKNLMFFLFIFVYGSQVIAKTRLIITHKNLSFVASVVKKNGGKVIKKIKEDSSLVVLVDKNKIKRVNKTINQFFEIEEDVIFSVGKISSYEIFNTNQVVPWNIERIGAIKAHEFAKGRGVRVCVLDTGVDLDHPDLKQNFVKGQNILFPNKPPSDNNGHGTHVAGIIAALDNDIGVVGVAPEAKIIPVKVFNKDGLGYSSDIADGIKFCIRKNADVINMSFGGYNSSKVCEKALKKASSKGIILVAAAGNESSFELPYPARYEMVIAVSGINENNETYMYTNYGSMIDYSAPAVSILSTSKGSKYSYLTGTSFAAPHVSGVAALRISSVRLKAKDIGLDQEHQGNGLIDASKTVE